MNASPTYKVVQAMQYNTKLENDEEYRRKKPFFTAKYNGTGIEERNGNEEKTSSKLAGGNSYSGTVKVIRQQYFPSKKAEIELTVHFKHKMIRV